MPNRKCLKTIKDSPNGSRNKSRRLRKFRRQRRPSTRSNLQQALRHAAPALDCCIRTCLLRAIAPKLPGSLYLIYLLKPQNEPLLVPWHWDYVQDLPQCSGPWYTGYMYRYTYVYIYIYMCMVMYCLRHRAQHHRLLNR